MTTYDVRVTRDGRFWYLEIPALDGATQARNLGEVDDMARDFIAVTLDIDPENIELNTIVELPSNVTALLEEVQAQRNVEVHARREAAEASRRAARELKQSGLTVREIGSVLHISHQRAQQLVSSP